MSMSLSLPPPASRHNGVGLLADTAAVIWHRLRARLSHFYHPERHYMRGPGPKCREKQIVLLVRQARAGGSSKAI